MNPNTSADPRAGKPSLLSALGLFSTLMFVVGAVIGSGVFRKPGVMASQLGSPGLLLAVWLVAGLVTLIGALVNAEIAAMIPEAGGQYVFFHRMYGSFVAYLYGWASFAVIKCGAIASLSYVFAESLGKFIPLKQLSPSLAGVQFHVPFVGDIFPLADIGLKSTAAGLILVLTAVNWLGVRLGSAVQNVFTVAKVCVLCTIVVLALVLPDVGSVSHFTSASAGIHLEGLALWTGLAAAIQGAFWAYDGWNDVTYVAGEVKDPQRNLPRGLLGGMAIVMAIYLSINLAYAYVLPIDQMAASKLVAVDVIEKFRAGSGRWIALGIMISTFGAANSNVMGAARIYFSMARHGVFPSFLGRVHPRFHTPGASLWVQAVWSIALLFSGSFDNLTDMLIFVAWVFYGAGAFGVFILRRKEPTTPRPYRVPGYPWLPWAFVGFTSLFLVLTLHHDISQYRAAVAAGKPGMINAALGAFLVAAGTPIYAWYRWRDREVTRSV